MHETVDFVFGVQLEEWKSFAWQGLLPQIVGRLRRLYDRGARETDLESGLDYS